MGDFSCLDLFSYNLPNVMLSRSKRLQWGFLGTPGAQGVWAGHKRWGTGTAGVSRGRRAGVCCSMRAPNWKSQDVLLQNPCCQILDRNGADVAQQFQDGARVTGSNLTLTAERDEILVTEKQRQNWTKKQIQHCLQNSIETSFTKSFEK